jgi:hypothetical protein
MSADQAVTIASAYVPPDALPNAKISCTTYPLDENYPVGWVVIFYFDTVQVTFNLLVEGSIPSALSNF